MTIETARLVLRELREDDAEALASVFGHPDVVRYSGGQSLSLPEVREGIRQHVATHYGERGFGLLAAQLRDTGKVVGRVGYLATELDETADAELHYHLSPEAWGAGLATEAARAVLDWGFRDLGFRRVVAAIHPDNVASRRVAEKCGFSLAREVDVPGIGALLLYEAGPPVPAAGPVQRWDREPPSGGDPSPEEESS